MGAGRPNQFVIEELNPLGGKTPPGGFARFEWDHKRRNIPRQPWSFGIHQRSVRTDYPGADDPTEQVLGPQFTPFTLEGRWDDRYNPLEPIPSVNAPADRREGRPSIPDIVRRVRGYAKAEREKFEAMVRRGNPVRITFEDITVQGIITDCQFDYRRSWDIGYSFTVSPHHRQPGGFFALKRSPRSVLNAKQLRNEVNAEVEDAAMTHERAPQSRLAGTLYQVVDTLVTEWSSQIGVIDEAIEQRNLSLETEANTALLRLGAAFLSLSSTGAQLIHVLRSEDSAEALDFERPTGVLDYDVWARALMSTARRIVVTSQRAASEIQQRAEPNAIALYRPQEGEHLYAISNRFYKTPHNWRTVFERNGLSSTTLTGEELLVIPEVTGR